jgi:hypothetical protein
MTKDDKDEDYEETRDETVEDSGNSIYVEGDSESCKPRKKTTGSS